jgi:hypothetical protein
VRQRFDTRFELDERTELGEARDAARVHVADLVGFLDSRPRVVAELLQAEGDLLLVVVNAQYFDSDLVTRLEHLRRVRHAGPPDVRDVQQPLYSATEIDKRAKVAHRRDTPVHDRAGDE